MDLSCWQTLSEAPFHEPRGVECFRLLHGLLGAKGFNLDKVVVTRV